LIRYFFNFTHHEIANRNGQLKLMHRIDVHVGKRLRGRRTMLGLSQEALASKLSISFQQLQKYERGANAMNARRLYQLSQLLGTSVAYFFEGLERRPKDGEVAGDSARIERLPPALDRDTMEMVKALTRIKDRKLRRSLAGLMRAIADAG
jgi:transcriptional regulator with XRE-family HTH domain